MYNTLALLSLRLNPLIMKRTLRRAEMLLHTTLITALLVYSIRVILSGMYFPGMLMLGFVLMAVVVTLNWKKLRLLPRNARLCCYYLEGLVFLINWILCVSTSYQELARISLIAAVALPFLGFMASVKTYKTKKRVA